MIHSVVRESRRKMLISAMICVLTALMAAALIYGTALAFIVWVIVKVLQAMSVI